MMWTTTVILLMVPHLLSSTVCMICMSWMCHDLLCYLRYKIFLLGFVSVKFEPAPRSIVLQIFFVEELPEEMLTQSRRSKSLELGIMDSSWIVIISLFLTIIQSVYVCVLIKIAKKVVLTRYRDNMPKNQENTVFVCVCVQTVRKTIVVDTTNVKSCTQNCTLVKSMFYQQNAFKH